MAKRRKGGAGKVKIVWRLRQRTTMTLKWIAQRLKMGDMDAHAELFGSKEKET